MENEVVQSTSALSQTIANLGGISGIAAASIIALERLGKAIPDTATGFWGLLRRISKFLSAYIPNRK